MNELTSSILTFTLVIYKYFCQLVVRLSSLKQITNKRITVCCAFCPIQPDFLWTVNLSCDTIPEPFVKGWIRQLYLYEWVMTVKLEDSLWPYVKVSVTAMWFVYCNIFHMSIIPIGFVKFLYGIIYSHHKYFM